MDDLLRDMGRRIMTRRKELCLTQEQVAAKTDLTVQTISTAERGVKALRPENMVKLCEALHMTADYLLWAKCLLTGFSSCQSLHLSLRRSKRPTSLP